MSWEAVGWILLVLTLFPAGIVVFLKNWTKKSTTNPMRSKEKETNEVRFTAEKSKEASGRQEIANPKSVIPVWNQQRLMQSRWLDKHIRVLEDKKLKLRMPMEVVTKNEAKMSVDWKETRYTNKDPPKLGHNCQFEGLLWRHFDHKGFHKIIQQWEKADLTDNKIRTLLTWDEMEKDLRFMAEEMLHGHRWTAHYYGKEHPDQWKDDDLLPDVYQIYRNHLPGREEGIQLKKEYAKMIKERKIMGKKLDEKQWKEAKEKRENMLDYKMANDEEKFTLFRHIKPRRKWGNSLYVYFEENSVLITSDEVV